MRKIDSQSSFTQLLLTAISFVLAGCSFADDDPSPSTGGAVSATSAGFPGSSGATAMGGFPGSSGATAMGGSPGSSGATAMGGSPGSSGATAEGGATSTGGASHVSSGNGELLPQEGNPVHTKFDAYKQFIGKEEIILSHQTTHGGWPKNQDYSKPGTGGGEATFDNGATTAEMTLMADAYKRTGDSKYLTSARKAMNYVLTAQYPEGGWPQHYPLAGGYHDHVTYNDDAMSRTLTVLQHAADKAPPFDGDVFTADQQAKIKPAIAAGVDYILKSQYVQKGKKTVWCAQHDRKSYKPAHARSYEYPTLSGSESVGIIGFLMTQPQTGEMKAAVIAAVDWFRSPDTYLADYAYNRSTDLFEQKPGSRAWGRFYDLETNQVAFSDYDAPLYLGLENQSKRKDGYRWGGDWGEVIIKYAESAGY